MITKPEPPAASTNRSPRCRAGGLTDRCEPVAGTLESLHDDVVELLVRAARDGDQRVVIQVTWGEDGLRSQRMVGSQVGRERLAPKERLEIEIGELSGPREERDIEPAVAEAPHLLDGVEVCHLDRQAGLAVPELREKSKELFDRQVRVATEANGRARLAAAAASVADRAVERGNHLPGFVGEDPTGVGDCDSATRAHEELDAQLILQLANRMGERGLGDVEPLGSPTEVQFLADRDEVAQMANINHGTNDTMSTPRAVPTEIIILPRSNRPIHVLDRSIVDPTRRERLDDRVGRKGDWTWRRKRVILQLVSNPEQPADPDVVCTLIGDDEDLLDAIEQLLQSEGIGTVAVATSGMEALTELESRVTNIVVLDLRLPDMDGLDVARRVFEIARRKTAVIIHTSVTSPDLVPAALDAGAAGVVAKGSPPERLLEAISVVADGGVYVDPVLLDARHAFL